MGKNLITVASFSTPLDAHMAKARLDSAGVFAVVFDEHTVGMNWLYSHAIGGVKVKVLDEDLQVARSILELKGKEAAGENEIQESWGTCPECASKDVEYISDKRGTFLSWLCLGIPFLPVRERMKCQACEHIWKYKR